MNFKIQTRYLIVGGFLLLILLIVVVDRVEDLATHISYPLDTWRVDMDDALVAMASFGTLLMGIAAFSMLWKRQAETARIAQRTERTINGGMSDAAKEHVGEALKDADVEQGLWKRVDAIEKSNKECLAREARMKVLMQDVYRRLDETGLGREEGRDD